MNTNQAVSLNQHESPRPGKILGRGREAEIISWRHELVLKLFFKRTRSQVEKEITINQQIHEADLPVPAVRYPIHHEGRHGIVFEYLHGESMLSEMSSKPWKLIHYAKDLAFLHSIMHRNTISCLPDQSAQLIQKIHSVKGLEDQTKELVVNQVLTLPKGQQLCHGDYHPDNVMITDMGSKIIDWTTASAGNPIADVARTSLILQLGELPPNTPLITKWVINFGRKLFHKLYLWHYFQLNPQREDELKNWLLPIAVARLSEGIVEEKNQLTNLIKKSVAQLS